MYIDKEQAEARFRDEKNGKVRLGRGMGKKGMGKIMQAIVGTTAKMDTAVNTAKQFGVSEHHVHELKNAKTHQESGVNTVLDNMINANLRKVNEKALDRLMMMIDLVDEDMIAALTDKPLTLIRAAKDMAGIVEKTAEKKNENSPTSNVQFNFFAPKAREEKEYQMVEINAESE